MDFMKYEIPFKTIQSYFQPNEHIFCNPSSSSIHLLTYNLQIPFPISVQSECPWVKSWDQINFFCYKSVLSSFSSVPVLAKKQLFSGPNEYHTFYLYTVFTCPPPLLLSRDTSTFLISSTRVILPSGSFLCPSYLLFTFLLPLAFLSPAPKSNPS